MFRRQLLLRCRPRLTLKCIESHVRWTSDTGSGSNPAGDAVFTLLDRVQSTSKRGKDCPATSYSESSLRKLFDGLRQQIDSALSVRRSLEQGNLFPKIVAECLADQYIALGDDLHGKAAFFELLTKMGSRSQNEIVDTCRKVLAAKDKDIDATSHAEVRLRASLIPMHQYVFVELGKLNRGVELLVNMRRDLLVLKRRRMLNWGSPDVNLFADTLRTNLAQWFSAGFLDLQCVTWQSPADLLEKIVASERVHPMAGLSDAKRRVGPMRRCFVYTHHLLPGEPLVILHVALGDELRSNIQDIIDNDADLVEKDELVRSATFYSISSTNPGLAGIDLGNLLIKTAVQKLQRDFSHIQTFGTLSPIPGFGKWLATKLASLPEFPTEGDLPLTLQGIDVSQIKEMYECNGYIDCLKKLKMILNDGSWCKKERLASLIEAPMMQLCARYLCEEKRRRSALDPVANFHLSNGAMVWRLNWMANLSENGIASSHGLMVNYKYALDDILVNNHNYIVNGQVTASEDVTALLSNNS